MMMPRAMVPVARYAVRIRVAFAIFASVWRDDIDRAVRLDEWLSGDRLYPPDLSRDTEPDPDAKGAAFLIIVAICGFGLGMYGVLMAFGLTP